MAPPGFEEGFQDRSILERETPAAVNPGGDVMELDWRGMSVIVALALALLSASEVAVTVTIWELEIASGAAYKPEASIPPTFGLRDQLTAVFCVLRTVAVNRCVWDLYSVAVAGLTDTWTGGGRTSTSAYADFVGSALLVATTLTYRDSSTCAGAVYNPEALTISVGGSTDQVTAVLSAP
jgi:hypothetical protein